MSPTARRLQRIRRVLFRRQPDLTVLMERVNKPHNFSAILRSCDAVGVLEAHAVVPDGSLDLHRATSGGSARWMEVHQHEDAEAALARLRDRGFQLVAAHPAPDAVDYREVDYTGPTAIVVGAELYGIGEASLAAADRTVVIPMMGMARSLNVSVATALLLFEAFRQRDEKGMYERRQLDDERYRELLFEWAHPRRAARLRERGEPYPVLDEPDDPPALPERAGAEAAPGGRSPDRRGDRESSGPGPDSLPHEDA